MNHMIHACKLCRDVELTLELNFPQKFQKSFHKHAENMLFRQKQLSRLKFRARKSSSKVRFCLAGRTEFGTKVTFRTRFERFYEDTRTRP